MTSLSRIDMARRKSRIARYAIGVSAAVALAAFAAAARATHPGSHTTRVRAGEAAASTSSYGDSHTYGYFEGGSSIGPSGGASSQLQSGGS